MNKAIGPYERVWESTDLYVSLVTGLRAVVAPILIVSRVASLSAIRLTRNSTVTSSGISGIRLTESNSTCALFPKAYWTYGLDGVGRLLAGDGETLVAGGGVIVERFLLNGRLNGRFACPKSIP